MPEFQRSMEIASAPDNVFAYVSDLVVTNEANNDTANLLPLAVCSIVPM